MIVLRTRRNGLSSGRIGINLRRQMSESRPPREFHEHRIFEREDFDQLAAAWNRLARKSGSPIEQYIWAKACAEALGDRYNPYVLVVGPPDRPVAIAPLARRQRRPLAP